MDSGNIKLLQNAACGRILRIGEVALSCLKIINLCCYHLFRVIIGSVFIFSGVVKLANVKGFAKMIAQYNLVPDQLLAPVSVGLPVLELLAGVGIIFEIPCALTAITGMLFMFISVLWYGILKDLDIDCGCFSMEELRGQDNLRRALYRDFLMLAACSYFYCYRFLRLKRGLPGGFRKYFKNII
jgi:uncharacterized membrane protein YphA (DoxX/SURF4 family)